ncbi:MAG TPA: hypothetical protein VFK33_01100 [Bacillales bacterium]|nr:hypothetical protein [Bacillales bacterium]
MRMKFFSIVLAGILALVAVGGVTFAGYGGFQKIFDESITSMSPEIQKATQEKKQSVLDHIMSYLETSIEEAKQTLQDYKKTLIEKNKSELNDYYIKKKKTIDEVKSAKVKEIKSEMDAIAENSLDKAKTQLNRHLKQRLKHWNGHQGN